MNKINSTPSHIHNIDIDRTAVIKKELSFKGEYLSLKLQFEIWLTLDIICKKERIPLPVMVGHINARKKASVTLENACRVFVVHYLACSHLPPNDQEELTDRYLKYIQNDI